MSEPASNKPDKLMALAIWMRLMACKEIDREFVGPDGKRYKIRATISKVRGK